MRGPVDQKPIAERHSTESEPLLLLGGHAFTIGGRPHGRGAERRRNTPLPCLAPYAATAPIEQGAVTVPPCVSLLVPAGGPQSRPPAGVSALPGSSLESRPLKHRLAKKL